MKHGGWFLELKKKTGMVGGDKRIRSSSFPRLHRRFEAPQRYKGPCLKRIKMKTFRNDWMLAPWWEKWVSSRKHLLLSHDIGIKVKRCMGIDEGARLLFCCDGGSMCGFLLLVITTIMIFQLFLRWSILYSSEERLFPKDWRYLRISIRIYAFATWALWVASIFRDVEGDTKFTIINMRERTFQPETCIFNWTPPRRNEELMETAGTLDLAISAENPRSWEDKR